MKAILFNKSEWLKLMSKNLNDCSNLCKDTNNCLIKSCLLSLPPKQFALLSSLFGIIIIDDLTVEQQNAIGNFLVNIGQTILTAAAQEQSLQSDNSQDTQIIQEIENLKCQIALLKEELDCQK
jgi:hypothetical protein